MRDGLDVILTMQLREANLLAIIIVLNKEQRIL